MRRLRKRAPAEVLQRQTRHRRQAWARWIYLASIVAVGLWVVDLFFGSYVRFRSDGMVLATRTAVATEFPARIRQIYVRRGDRVAPGDILAALASQHVTESLARLTSEYAGHRTRLAELRIRRHVAQSVAGLASTRAKVASDTRKQLERLHRRGLLPLGKRTSALDSEFRSRQDLEMLAAERQAIGAEIADITAALREVEGAIKELRTLYDGGQLRSPVRGVVTQIGVARGSVVQPGQEIMDLHSDQLYVLAYIPTGTLYEMAPGDRVAIRYGLDELAGEIERLEPVAAALPREFQRAFKPVERAQLARISLDPGQDPPPLFSKVRVTAAGWPPAWLGRLAARWGIGSAPRVKTAAAGG